MKVYIIISSCYEDYTILDVYSSFEQAKKRVDYDFDQYVSNDKYEYKLIQDTEFKNEYTLFRYKKYNFEDGLVNKNYIKTYTIEERMVI